MSVRAMVAAVAAVAAVSVVAGALRRRRDLGRAWTAWGGERPGRWSGAVVLVSAVALLWLLVGPVGAGGAVVAAGATRRWGRVRSRRRREARTAAAVPELVDLFRLAAAAGLPVAGALEVVARRAPSAVRSGMIDADRRRQRGLPLHLALERMAEVLGPRGAELVDVLARSARHGVAVGPLLAELAHRDRAERRSRARAAAGRLSVAMLFPLVLCILPAAIALAVVPVLVVSLGELTP
jgi:tight adherence protein C